VIALGAEIGADLRAIAIVQTMRVVIVAVGLPSGLALLGLVGPSARRVGGSFSFDLLGELAVLVAASTVAAILAYRTRFPGGLLFGAMLTSAALHGGGWIHAVTPWWVANAAMIALGAVSGSRFANMSFPLLAKYIVAALGSFAVAVLIGSLFAAGLIGILSLRAADVLIAFAPGSVDAMMLLALALNLDPVYVGAHHLARIFFVSLSMPVVLRLSNRQAKLRGAVVPPQKPFQD
jgi:membrane AbrB-like protein